MNSTRKKDFLIVFLVVLVAIVIFFGLKAVIENQSNKIAAECLSGSQTACALFQARENVAATEILLQEAKTNLATAREAYKASQVGE